MGFPSLVQDYVEQRLNLNDLLMPNPANMMRIETLEGGTLIDRSARMKSGFAPAENDQHI
ncbi:hypothetical protein [Pantoea sp. UYEF8]|uniref:hypothetical protein n=1 Tax=Pantoea sp. UYEF8 TaxID=1756394 RepID=UPI00339B5FC3